MDYVAIFAELQIIRRQNDALLALLTGQQDRRRGGMTTEKRQRLVALLPVIHAAVRGAVFTVTDLEEKSIEDAALAAALPAAFGSGRTWRLIAGNLFAACVGTDVDGLTIERRTNAREGAVWAVVETAGFKGSAKSQTRAHR